MYRDTSSVDCAVNGVGVSGVGLNSVGVNGVRLKVKTE